MNHHDGYTPGMLGLLTSVLSWAHDLPAAAVLSFAGAVVWVAGMVYKARTDWAIAKLNHALKSTNPEPPK